MEGEFFLKNVDCFFFLYLMVGLNVWRGVVTIADGENNNKTHSVTINIGNTELKH